MFVWPHGIHVDRDGNVWVTDSGIASPDLLAKFPGAEKKGSIVVKFSPEGKVLMMLGKPGVQGNPPEALTEPTVVLTDPRNGDVLCRRKPLRREWSQSCRPHFRVRQKRQIPARDREDRQWTRANSAPRTDWSGIRKGG